MALSDISLTGGMRSTLNNLQGTANLMDRTQVRLSTGKKVNSALDDPVNFFKALAHSNRASDLASRKDGMSEAIQLIKAADTGIKGLTDLLNSAKSIATAARTATDTARLSLVTQYNSIRDQISALAEDSGYGGKNLLANDTMSVIFNEDSSNKLDISGFYATTAGEVAGVTLTVATLGTFTDQASIDTTVQALDNAIDALRSQSSRLSTNMGILTARQDFTSNMIATLKTGADNLTLADMNEEGANMLMLQTRQALGTSALSMASQAAQSVLRLF